MNLFSHLPIVIFFLFALSIVSCGQNKSVDPKLADEFAKIYEEFNEGTKKRDITVIEKYLDKDYELQDGKTTTKRAEVIKKVKDNFAAMEEVIESSAKIENIEIKDGSYFLKASSTMIATYKLPNGKITKIETIAVSTDIWTKTAAGWKEIKQILHSLKIIVDGKEVPG